MDVPNYQLIFRGGKQSTDKLCSCSTIFFFDWLVDVSGIKKLVSSSQVAAPSLDSNTKYKHSNYVLIVIKIK